MSDVDAVVRIKELQLVGNGVYTIDVKPQVNNKGDIGYLSGIGATEIKFKIAGEMNSAPGWKYKFKAKPFCAYEEGAGTSCTVNDQPVLNFTISNRTDKTFVLAIPDIGTTTTVYNYLLFAERTKPGQREDIIIDPKIKPGSVALTTNTGEPLTPSAAASSDGLSSMALVGSAILLVSLGVAIGLMANKA